MACLCAAALLSACGGGGGGGGMEGGSATPPSTTTTPPTTPPPAVPAVSGVSSASVEVGKSFVVNGSNLGRVSGFQVGGATLNIVSATPAAVTLSVPASPVSGVLTLLVDGASVPTNFRLDTYVALAVGDFTPAAGVVGATVTVNGVGMGGVGSVRFANGAVANVAVPHPDTSLSFAVPAGAGSGPLSLSGTYNQVTTTASFTVVPPVTVASISSSVDGATLNVLVQGANLSAVRSASIGAANAAIVSASAAQLRLSAPAGSSGAVVLTAPDQAPLNAGTVGVQNFTIGSIDFAQVFSRNISDPTLRLTRGKAATLRAAVLSSTPGRTSPAVSVDVYSAAGALLGRQSMSGPPQLAASKDDTSLGSTFNTLLPGAWMEPGMRLTVSAAGADAGPLVQMQARPSVAAATRIRLVLVPLATRAGTSALPSAAAVQDALLRIYPYAAGNISVSLRQALPAGGNNTSEEWWNDTLFALETARLQEDPGAFYYGFTPAPSVEHTAGLGYIGNRFSGIKPGSALGLDATRSGIGATDPFANAWPEWLTILLHELGHNHSLQHVACGPVDDADPSYPYPNGELGPQPLYNSLYNASAALDDVGAPFIVNARGATERMKDVMGYCSGVWMSDFSYTRAQQFAEGLANVQSAQSLTAKLVAGPSNGYLTISGTIRGGSVKLRPALASSGRLRPEVLGTQHAYTLRVLTRAGQTFNFPFDADAVADGRDNISHFAVSLANPGDIAGVDVLYQGVALSQAAAARAAGDAASGLDPGPASLDWTLAKGKLELRWNAAAEPVLALLYKGPDGRKTVLANALAGGSASVDLQGLAPGGTFEVSLAGGLKARLVQIAYP